MLAANALTLWARLRRSFEQPKQKSIPPLLGIARRRVGLSRLHMGLGYRRTDLQKLAEAKLYDAKILLKKQRWSNAYYLAGYAVEIGLKACIAAQISAETIPDKSLIKKVLDHDFGTLVGLAGLAPELKTHVESDENFSANWAVVREWSPDSRYESLDPTSAQAIISAIADPNSGVFQWIKAHW